jgi:capsular exopolysaccharide synthesis family protein
VGDDRRRSLRDGLDDLGVERSPAPDVEVYRLTDTVPPSSAPERLPTTEEISPEEAAAGNDVGGGVGSSRWLDEVRTSIWEDSQRVDEQPKKRITARMPAVGAPVPSHPEPVVVVSPQARVAQPVAAIASPQARVAQPVAAVHVGRALVPTRPPVDVGEDPFDEPRPSTHAPLLIESAVRIKVRAQEEVSLDSRLWVLTDPGSAGAEQYRVLSLKLREGQDPRVVAIVAPNAQAQGCVAASNVALAIGEGRRSRVLLLDANLRHPEIGALFGVPPQTSGLGEQLRQHRRASDDPWVVLGVNTSVHLLTAGAAEPNPSALLGSEAFADLVSEARRFFDYVVISAPPVMESADSHILLEQIDGAVLIARARVTRRDSISASVSRLGVAKFLGVVLVGV